MTPIPIVETAVALTDIGLAVFPVGPDCRVPRCEHGWKDASSDPAIVRQLFAGGNHNLACATGDPSGVFVLDIDCKGVDGFASLSSLEAEHGDLPCTWTTLTPSGGRHLWFRKVPDRAERNRVGFRPGLDIRTTGGSVALPPSRKPGGSYSWLVDPADRPLADAPEWLLALLDPPPAPPRTPVRFTTSDRAGRYVEAALNAECGELARMAPNTGRNQRLFQAAANLGSFVGSGWLPQSVAQEALERAAEECGLPADVGGWHGIRATIRSGMERGVLQPREVRP